MEGLLAPPLESTEWHCLGRGAESQVTDNFLPSLACHGLLLENIFLSSHLLIIFWSLMIKFSVSKKHQLQKPLQYCKVISL